MVFVLAFGSCGAFTWGIFALLKSSDAYTESLKQVQANDAVKNLIGSPVEPGFWLTGSININGSSGNADISYPVSGPKGSGTVYVVGTKSEGSWHYSKISFVQESSDQRVDLITVQEE